MFAYVNSLFRNLFQREWKEQDLDEEIRSHLVLLTDEKIRDGMSPEDAARQARVELGGVEQVKERVRTVRAGVWLETMWQDLRFGARILRKSPGSTVVAVLTLALGIGANTAIFSVANAVLLRPLPYVDSDRLVLIWNTYSPAFTRLGLSPGDFEEFQTQNRSFSEMAAYVDAAEGFNLTGEGQPGRVNVSFATADLFPMLGVRPTLGRSFDSEEDIPGKEPVVILSREFWANRFGLDPAVVGRTIILDGRGYKVIGVLPADFQLVPLANCWMPVGEYPDDLTSRIHHPYSVVARLKKGVTIAEAKANLDVLNTQAARAFPDTHKNWGIMVEEMKDPLAVKMRSGLLALSGAVALILLIACSNIMNLLLAKNTSRRREIALRIALGASRARLATQLLTESTLLALLGGVAGLLLAVVGLHIAVAFAPPALPTIRRIGMDLHVLAFTAGICVLTGILCGLAPVVQAAESGAQGRLNEGGRATRHLGAQKLSNFLVTSEIALALVLVVGAGLLIRSLDRLLAVQPGFPFKRVLTLEVDQPALSLEEYGRLTQQERDELTNKQSLQFEQLAARIRSLPGVEDVGAVSVLPLASEMTLVSASRFLMEGQATPEGDARPLTQTRVASLRYFSAMGIPLLRGRLFNEKDWGLANVVINMEMVRQNWPNEDPLGKRINLCSLAPTPCWFSIVGVVGDVHQFGPDGLPTNDTYFAGGWPRHMVIRTKIEPDAIVPTIVAEIHQTDPNLPVTGVTTMDHLFFETVSPREFSTALLTTFAALAFLLAAAGVYGLTSYLASTRTMEIGVRMALGAQRTVILKMVTKKGMKLALAGVCIGIVCALALTYFLRSMLYDVTPMDPTTFITVIFLLLGVALVACYIPARRATRVDPMVALRHE